jgi:hypothetical protein
MTGSNVEGSHDSATITVVVPGVAFPAAVGMAVSLTVIVSGVEIGVEIGVAVETHEVSNPNTTTTTTRTDNFLNILSSFN